MESRYPTSREVDNETRYRQLRLLSDNELICVAVLDAPKFEPHIRALTDRVHELRMALNRANADLRERCGIEY